MPVVQNTVTDPGGEPLASINVRITLMTGSPNTPGYISGGDITGTYSVATDATGHWSATLPGNASITPANSYYQVVEGQAVSPIIVPATGGPYLLGDLLVTPPPTPGASGITGIQVAGNGAVAGSRPEINLIAGTGMGVTAADNPGAARVDVTLTSTGGASPATTVQTGTAYGVGPAVGTDTSYAREDHQHGTVTLTSTAPAAVEGIGQAAALGTAATPARADHVHPTAAAAAPGASGVGDTTATGTSTSPAAADHRHARESFGAVTALSAFNTASANGSAATVSRSDHVHGAPALPAATAYSRQILIAADGAPSTVTPSVGTWTPTYLMASDTGGVWSGWISISDGAQNDAVSFDFACGAGTYTVELRHLPYTNRGTYTIQVDGTSVGTIDGYATALAATRSLLPGVAITAGAHVITLAMLTKNASSSGYVGLIERLVLTRTA